MKKMFLFAVAICIVCACTRQQFTRDEQLSLNAAIVTASTKEYTGFSREKIADAVTKVLTLIDPTDAKFMHTKNKIVMTRYYTGFFVFNAVHGYDFWIVNLDDEKENTVKVSVAVGEKNSSGMFATLPSPSIPTVMQEDTLISEAEAKLFFNRVDYFLEIEKHWIDCKSALDFAINKGYRTYKESKPGVMLGHFPYICGDGRLGVEDKSPNYLEK